MRGIVPLILALILNPWPANDEKEHEVELPYVVLTQPPYVDVLPPHPLTEERKREIEELIDGLAGLKSPDIGLLKNPIFATVFVPVGEFESIGPLVDEDFESFPALKRLIEIGPDALPQLLEALESSIPTELVVEPDRRFRFGMAFDEVIPGNPALPAERRILGLDRKLYSKSIRDNTGIIAEEMASYRVKVGDVCLAIIGQIVSRDYRPLTYAHPKDLSIIVSSPVHRKALRKKVRKIWNAKNPRQKVLESLLLDFCTRGIEQGESTDTWSLGCDIQLEAVKRMLYYFPNETSDIVAARLDGFAAEERTVENWMKSGVRTDGFVHAVSWCKDKRIQQALERLRNRAQDKDLLKALENHAEKDMP